MQSTHSTFGTAIGKPAPAASPAKTGRGGAYWALRVGAAMCFIGHGAFGFITKAAWIPYFGVIGIPESWAWKLMPLIGAVDVTAGMAVLLAPRALPLVYMSVWALWTALLRPLSGENPLESVERAGNYGVPFALLLLTGMPRSWHELMQPLDRPASTAHGFAAAATALKWTTALLLLGHGALGALLNKPTLTTHYATIGLPSSMTALVGWFEIALAVAVAVRPVVGL